MLLRIEFHPGLFVAKFSTKLRKVNVNVPSDCILFLVGRVG